MIYADDRLTYRIVGAAALAPIAVLLQMAPPFFITPWFMRIDLVAVPWILCWMIFGFKAALLSMLISVPLVGFVGPFAGGVVGMVMKAIASVWMFAIPALLARLVGNRRAIITHSILYVVAVAFAILVRDVMTVLLNFYFALPVFFGMKHEEILDFFSNPRFQSFVSSSFRIVGLASYIVEVAFWNTAQGLVDAYVALAIALTVSRRGFLYNTVAKLRK